MLLQILANTPKWVFALFAALLWLGLSQLLTRRVGLSRITGLKPGILKTSSGKTFDLTENNSGTVVRTGEEP